MKPLLCSALLLLTLSLGAQAPTAVPIPKEPHHHLVLENSYVRVFRVSVPAHQATLLHQHDVPYLYVALGPADVINAVQGKPEVRLVMADGQLGYSPGHFAHIARTDSGLVFNNVTIELLHPQAEPRNLCERVVDGPFKECLSDFSKLPPYSPLIALAEATRQKRLFETDEILVTSFSIGLKQNYTESDSQPARLLVVEDNSELRVDVPGQSPRTLCGGEVLWLEAGKKWTIATLGQHRFTRFLLIRFNDGYASKKLANDNRLFFLGLHAHEQRLRRIFHGHEFFAHDLLQRSSWRLLSVSRRPSARVPCYFLVFHSPTVLPSGSCIHANVPVGISTGGTSILPPSDFAFSRYAATSSTST
jgi:hypothetical protein